MKFKKWLGLLIAIVFLTSMIPLATPIYAATVGVYVDGTPSSATGAANASSVSFSHTTGLGENRLMLVGISWNTNTTTTITISSVTFSYGAGPTVLTLNPVITQKHGSNNRYVAIYSYVGPPSGQAGTVAVTFSAAVASGIVAGAANFAGVDQTTGQSLGTAVGASSPSNNTTPTVNVTGLNGNELVFDTVFVGGNPNHCRRG